MKFYGYYNKENKGLIGFLGRLLNTTNTFELKCGDIDRSEVSVIWKTETFTDTLVNKGKYVQDFGYDYGREDFIVIYKNLKFSNGFFSTNNNLPHNVTITLSKQNSLYT